MNCIHAKAEWIEGAWRAMVRYAHKAEYWPVMDGDRPAAYPTKDAAELAALRAQEKHINGTITGFGDKVEAAKAVADRLFLRGGKTVAVEPRHRRRA